MTQQTEQKHLAQATIERMLDAVRDRDVPAILDSIHLAGTPKLSFPEGPRWSVSEADTVQRGWNDYMDNPVVLTGWDWIQGPVVNASDDMALVAGIIDYRFTVDGRPNPLKMRMSWVVRQIDGVWKCVHEHGSQPLPDPYGLGDWLKEPPAEGDAAWAGERPVELGPLQVAEKMLNSVVTKDLEGVVSCFSPAADAYMYVEGPRWTTTGGHNVRSGWTAYFESGMGIGKWAWVEGPHVFADQRLAQVVGVIDYEMIGGDKRTPLRLRMTWLMRREEQGWQIIHEHGSQPLEDPYGAGDWWPDGRTALDG